MPATERGIRIAGVDGCPFGWIAVGRLHATSEFTVAIADRFSALLNGPLASTLMIVVDMPIGLPETPGRTCERQTRRAIGPRRSSVFSAPLRGMLAFDRYEDANAYGKERGAGLSKQAWNITPKIRELDTLMTPAAQARIAEGHPELAFARLGTGPCLHAKRDPEGKDERLRRLKDHGVCGGALLAAARKSFPASRVFSDDDLLDAAALALTAEARLAGTAWRMGDGARDARGLVMEISG
jgi:predicted RNase H-like nuclease